ncbi:MAG: DUF975 family protein [Peptostreptococcaceae bacterium]|nr:DUF975 family protein [Peptostreptococcaceae bacterium]
MNNYLVKDSASEIRGMSRFILKNKWVAVVIGVLIYQIMLTLIPDILATLFPTASYFNEIVGETTQTSMVSGLYNILMLGALTYGFRMYILAILREGAIHYDNLFEGFSHYLKAFGLTLVTGMFIFLWSLLFIVPGIIAYYRYSQAYFILVDDPSKGILQCINESKIMMVGNKAHLFGVYISFLGWYLLGFLPAFIAAMFMTGTSEVTYTIIFNICLIIPMSIVSTYFSTAETIYYELLKFGKREDFPYEGEKGLKPNIEFSSRLIENNDEDK